MILKDRKGEAGGMLRTWLVDHSRLAAVLSMALPTVHSMTWSVPPIGRGFVGVCVHASVSGRGCVCECVRACMCVDACVSL